MLTLRFLRLLRRVLNVNDFVRCVPFSSTNTSKNYPISLSKANYISIIDETVCCHYLVYALFSVAMIYEEIRVKKGIVDFSTISWCLIFMVAYSCSFIFSASLLECKRQIVTFFQTMKRFDSSFEGNC
jgi:hypothetical protein